MFTLEERGVYGGEGTMDGWDRVAGSSMERGGAEEDGHEGEKCGGHVCDPHVVPWLSDNTDRTHTENQSEHPNPEGF